MFSFPSRLVGLFLVVASLLALAPPASAGEDNQDPNKRFNDWVTRVKTRVLRTAEKLPADWQRHIPRPQIPQWPDEGPIPTGRSVVTAADLDRVEIGYMAGVLKIASADGRIVFVKRRAGSDLVAIDSVEYAPLDDGDRHDIFRALRIHERELDAVSQGLMHDYSRLPHTKAIAILGVIASSSDPSLSWDNAQRIRNFLADRLKAEKDVKVHRMAVLSLALAAETDRRTVDAVLDFMDRSNNSWETFTTQQFFRYHRDEIRSHAWGWNVRRRLATTGNPYGPIIAANF